MSESVLCNEQSKADQISFSNSIVSRGPSDLVTVFSWNGQKFQDSQYFYDVKKFSTTSDIIMIQEAMHSAGWQAAFASHMSMSFSFHKSFCDFDNLATGVMTAARYQLEEPLTLTSPGTEPGSFTPKVSGYSTVTINNKKVHLINTHALNFNTGRDFEQQIEQLADFISKLNGPIIWAGDFNTWSPGRKAFLNMHAAKLGLIHLVPSVEPRLLILDHIYVRGFTPVSAEIIEMDSSDHDPIRAVLKLN